MRRIWGKEVLDTLEEIVHPPRTALLVVDVQNDFCHPQGFYGRTGEDLGEIEATIPKIERLVEAGRGAGLLVVWIKQVLLPEAAADSGAWLRFRTRATVAHGLAGDEGANRQLPTNPRELREPPAYTIPGTWGQQLVDKLCPQPGDAKVDKHRSSAFVGTALDLILRSNGIRTVVVCGVITQGCVESTARDAQFLEYYVVLARDCVSTTDPDIHTASLICQSTRYDFANSNQLIACWNGHAAKEREN